MYSVYMSVYTRIRVLYGSVLNNPTIAKNDIMVSGACKQAGTNGVFRFLPLLLALINACKTEAMIVRAVLDPPTMLLTTRP